MRLITFSLFGDNPLYCFGAVENAKLAKAIYPDWTARFYVAQDVPIKCIEDLEEYGAQVVHCERKSPYDGLNWRFRPFNEDDVDVWISRDCDSRLNWRERRAVDEWLSTDKSTHLMRDGHNHSYTIMAGMFGINNKLFHSRYGKLILESLNYSREDDQTILHHAVWNRIVNDHVCHDHWNHNKPVGNPTTQPGDHVDHDKAYGGVGIVGYVTGAIKVHHPYMYPPNQDNRPFPTHEPMEYGIFVGQIIDENNKPKMNTDVRWEYELRGISYA